MQNNGTFYDPGAWETDTSAANNSIYLCSLLTALIKPKQMQIYEHKQPLSYTN